MGKDKLKKFAENKTFRCLVQPEFDEIFGKDHPLKGRWHADFFRNDRPIVLELGCGKGEYTVALAADDPARNYIGVDIKGARMWRGAKTATEQGMDNVGFLRTRIEFITSFFAPGEVSELWITFPDPQLKTRRAKKRLTAPPFLACYAQLLAPGGWINLKTDSQHLYRYTAAADCAARSRIPTSTARDTPTRCFRSRRPTNRCFSIAACRSPIPALRWTTPCASTGSTGRRTTSSNARRTARRRAGGERCGVGGRASRPAAFRPAWRAGRLPAVLLKR